MQTDAFDTGIGAVLSQVDEKGKEHPIGFISRQLKDRELRWSTVEKECFSVVWALRKLRPYLYGTHFTVQTDHKPLKWLMNMKGENPKLLRWSISLQGFDFTIEHRPGVQHSNADGLSRMFNRPEQETHPGVD